MLACINKLHNVLDKTRSLSFLAPLALRLFLAPVMISAGLNKLNSFENTVAWFGNPEWGLGLPMPEVMTSLAIAAEVGGGFALLIGLAIRWATIPLMVTMLVAALTVHWDNGWFAVAPGFTETSMAKPLAAVGFPGAEESLQNSEEVAQRLAMAKSILKQHGNYSWLTEKGNFVVLNNGIEFAATYFVMLLSLFFTGAGRVSFDHLIARKYRPQALE